MSKAQLKRDVLANRLADFVLDHGLPEASLRPLAVAAETSDRMLLYYFKDKEDIIATVLGVVASRLADRLSGIVGGTRLERAILEAQLIALVTSDELWPFMCVWLEIAALAGRGDVLFRAIGKRIGGEFLAAIEAMLDCADGTGCQSIAWRVLQAVEGAIVLKSIDLG